MIDHGLSFSLNIFSCLFMYNGVGLQDLSTFGSARPLQHNNTASMANIFTNIVIFCYAELLKYV